MHATILVLAAISILIHPRTTTAAPIPLTPDVISGTFPDSLTHPLMQLSHRMTGVADVLSMLPQLDGSGIKIGVADTGIDATHPALAGKIAAAADLTAAVGAPGGPVALEDATTVVDCTGHGTHVAGIIAGTDARVAGVAPNASLTAYKIFGCTGGTTEARVISSLTQATADGMDVVNLSLGIPGGWPDSPAAMAAQTAVGEGLWVVAAQGNDGPLGLFATPAPGVSPAALSVGAVENPYFLGGFLTLSANTTRNITYAGTTSPLTLPATSPLISLASDSCTAVDPGGQNFTQAIVLLQRGGCSFNTKATNLKAVGAVAMVVYDNTDGLYRFALDKPATDLVIAAVTKDDGLWMKEIVEATATAPSVVWDGGLRVMDNPDGGTVAQYSSWGPAPSLQLKPDIVAPGSVVYSTFPVANGSYYALSGTSMASPYTSASLALLRQHLTVPPGTAPSFADATNRLLSTAMPVRHRAIANRIASAALQGCGLINMKAAINTVVQLSPAKMAVGQVAADTPLNVVMTLTHTGAARDQDAQFDLSHSPATTIDLADPSVVPPIETDAYAAAVTFDGTTVAIPVGQTINITATIHPPATDPSGKNYLISGALIATPSGAFAQSTAAATLHATYMALVGSYTALPILPANGTYPIVHTPPSGQAAGIAEVVLAIQLPLRSVTVHLLTAATTTTDRAVVGGAVVGTVGQSLYIGPSRPTTSFIFTGQMLPADTPADVAFGVWDGGEVSAGPVAYGAVPTGDYVLRITFGRDVPTGAAAVTEEWTSASFAV
ncbi:peptidase S8/S53 domain-containing protein [Fimicolochytrium jonesii]|uniref:peptidase S8/S53 domain-containing protein n=1 Tax=Fimicolochytrium jonesii TaxID=1396493 RepID=UPI0022FEDF03|nr:peptidase S8/S53 domain-containing protein [Fimicolochytrium jonesii]KAI8824185.1 peptidase S8/S53 domain-containing protein [Fimicolochytrium jonesii]